MSATPASSIARPRTPSSAEKSPPRTAVRAIVVLALLIGGGYGLSRIPAVRSAASSLLPVGAGSTFATYEVNPVTLSVVLNEDGELKPAQSTEVKCEVEGSSTILYIIPESTPVKKGDLLVELASDELVNRLETEEIELKKMSTGVEAARQDLDIRLNQNTSDIKKAELDLELAELEYEKYLNGDFEKSLKGVNLDIEQTEMDITRRQEDLDKNKRLQERGFVTDSKIEQLEFELRKSELMLDRHQLTKEILLKYDKRKMERQLESAVERAREELERTKQRADSLEKQALANLEQNEALFKTRERRFERMKLMLDRSKIYAPTAGIVKYAAGDSGGWRDEDRIATGVRVREGQVLIQLPDTSEMLVTTRVHEADRHKLSEGLPALVRVPAVPGRAFRGHIRKIDQFADSAHRWFNPDLKEHSTEIVLEETVPELSPGDTAQIEILVETVQSCLAVPVQCVFSRGPKSFVFRDGRAGAEPVEVKIGRASTNLIEIESGLQSGDRVLMHANEKLLAMLPAGDAVQNAVDADAQIADKAGADQGPAAGGGTGQRGGPRRAGGPGARPGAGRPSVAAATESAADATKAEEPAAAPAEDAGEKKEPAGT